MLHIIIFGLQLIAVTESKLQRFYPSGTLFSIPSHSCSEPWEVLIGNPSTGFTCKPYCTHSATSCDFYSCISQQLNCSATDFPISYGLKYCRAFAAAAPNYSPAGQAWQLSVRHCLQEALMPDVRANNATCKQIAEHAVASHARCYVENGLCELEREDRRWIMRTVGWGPWLEHPVDTAGMVVETEMRCLRIRGRRLWNYLWQKVMG